MLAGPFELGENLGRHKTFSDQKLSKLERATAFAAPTQGFGDLFFGENLEVDGQASEQEIHLLAVHHRDSG